MPLHSSDAHRSRRSPVANSLALLAALAVFVFAPLEAAQLPILVAQGASATDKQTKTVTVPIPSNAGTIDRLWLKIHNVAYDNQVEVKAGSSAWIKLRNNKPGVIIESKGKDYGGIGGGFRTLVIQVDIPNNAVSSGSNASVSFRLGTLASATTTSPESLDISAYRIVGLDFVNTNGNRVLPGNAHSFPSPNNYNGITNTNAAKNAGGNLWSQQDILQSYPGGPAIKASCASCHTHDGRDLKYFGFSNNSIIQRAKFHGMSSNQAKNVASYIRSRDGGAPGRPWNPPYQPGPNALSGGVSQWAAGEGLGAVKGSDLGSLDALFPDTNNNGKRDQAEIDAKFHTGNGWGTANRLETFRVPISIQLPDWNRWIPLVAPEDVWSNFRTVSDSPWHTYENIRSELDSKGVDWYLEGNTRKAGLVTLLNSLGKDARKFIGKKKTSGTTYYDPGGNTSGSQWRVRNGPRVTGLSFLGGGPTYQREMAKRVIAAWLSVKYFEIMTEYELEDKCDDIFNDNPEIANGRARGERRGWPTAQQNVHANAPHITSATLDHWVGQDTLVGDYTSSVWYHLQMILNAGQRQKVDTVSPQDWEYQLNHIFQLSEKSGRDEPLRFVESMMKIYQVRDNRLVQGGWMLRMTHPWRALSMSRTGTSDVIDTLNDYDPGLYTRIANATVKEHVDVVTANNFEAKNLGNTWERYDPLTSTAGNPSTTWWKLEVENTPLTAHSTGPLYPRHNAQAFYNMFPQLRYLGVKADRINNLKSWCSNAWPGTNWSATTAPNPGTFYKIQNTGVSNRSLRGESVVGERAKLDTNNLNGARVRWTPIAANGDEWFRLRRQNYSNDTQHWLRLMPTVVAGVDRFRVEMGTNGNTGTQTQFRFLPEGSNRFRIEGRAYGIQWLRGDGTDVQHVDANSYTGAQTLWKFVP